MIVRHPGSGGSIWGERMRCRLSVIVGGMAALSAHAQNTAPVAAVEKPAAIVADGVPPVPSSLADSTRPYLEFRTAAFQSWNPVDRSALILTRFGNTAQVHSVRTPGAARTQLSFEVDRISGAAWSPSRGDVMVVQKDTGGDEFFQLYTLAAGRLSLLTDGKSRNLFDAWAKDGSVIGYSSTRRNGTDTDLYVMDPRHPETDRRVAEVSGGGWSIASFAPDSKRAAVIEYILPTKSNLYLLDLASGQLRPVGDHGEEISYGRASFAPDGTLWVTSDEGSEFRRLGTVDLATGEFTPRAREEKWEVEAFDVADDGSFVAYQVNEAGAARLKLLDTKTGIVRSVDALPLGQMSGLSIAPWGEIGLSFASARSAGDVYSVNPKTLVVTRWTASETGGLDVGGNVEPELVEVRSFDGTTVSGFLYRPRSARFPGKRPLIVEIHGGPASQSRPGFLGRNNYLLNELGIAIFRPNVRGSTGYGKTFVSLDDGPARREDTVRDIGAFLDRLADDGGLDGERFAVTGGSYGGYMCYASAIRYGSRLRAANCVVAISNWVTFLEHTQSYRRDLRRVEYGDERDPEQRAKLTEISPLSSVAKLDIPLMVVTGGNDPRVPPSEAAQMVAAVRERGGLVWHLLAKDEGHGFAKKANQDYQFWATLMFWQRTLLD
jgi:dipeptidyl aminopeptidase/acylaminoacyl peptidase